jgi:hypothetical protein
MRSVIIIIAIACLYSQSAHANGAQSFLTGFMHGITEQEKQNNARRDAQQEAENTENANNALLAEYQQCLNASPESSITTDFISVYQQTYKCSNAISYHIIRDYPDSPILWLVGNTQKSGDLDSQRITQPEVEHVKMLLNNEKECLQPVLNYSGARNAYVSKIIRSTQKQERDRLSVFNEYLTGKITRAEVRNALNRISAASNARDTKIKNEPVNEPRSNQAARAKICDAQLAIHQQTVQHQQQMREQQQVVKQQIEQMQQLQLSCGEDWYGRTNCHYEEQ